MAYSLRAKPRKNYKEMADIQLPRSIRARNPEPEDKLYPVEVVERDAMNRRVKVHYLGYGTEYDEWKEDSEIETLSPPIEGRLYLEYTNHCIYMYI